MSNPSLLTDGMRLSPISTPLATPRSSFIEQKSRTNSVDNPIVGKTQRVYPQLFTITPDLTEKEVKDKKDDNWTEENKSVSPLSEKKKSIESEESKKKDKIPKALREQVWLHYAKKTFDIKCPVSWCENRINPFDFHVGHNIAEANGGTLDINNLKPICSRCNLSMSSNYTIDEWDKLAKPAKPAESMKKTKCNIM